MENRNRGMGAGTPLSTNSSKFSSSSNNQQKNLASTLPFKPNNSPMKKSS
jgi:hypothetical protein